MPDICLIGMGVRGTSLLERLAANAMAANAMAANTMAANTMAAGLTAPLTVHLVDPYPPGPGQTWRVDQDLELLMNTPTGHTTVFVDESVDCAGPAVPGPTLREWCNLVLGGLEPDRELAEGPLRPQLEDKRPDQWYPSRALYGHYLAWCLRRICSSVPPGVQIAWHRAKAVRCVRRADGRQVVSLDTGDAVTADVVAVATGWLPARPSAADQRMSGIADRAGSRWIRPGQPCEQDLAMIRPGEDVIVRGFAMSFFDCMALLTIGRGGRFDVDGDRLCYVPSGREPVLWVGSGRGVPSNCRCRDSVPDVEHRFLARLTRRAGGRDSDADIWPLIRKDALLNYYRTMDLVRPGAVLSMDELESALAASDVGSRQWGDMIAALVPDPSLRLDLAMLEAPAEREFSSQAEFDAWLQDYVVRDLAESRLGRRSPLRAAAHSIGDARKVLAPAAEFGGLTPRSYGSGYAHLLRTGAALDGGPPPLRTAQLLALLRAGIVRGIGPWLSVRHDGNDYVASSPAVRDSLVRASVLLDARLDWPAASRTADPLLASLIATGRARAHVVRSGTSRAETGAVDVDRDGHAIGGNGPDQDLFVLGIPVEGARIHTVLSPTAGANSPLLRETDAVARRMLCRAARAVTASGRNAAGGQ